jgi:prepilin-type N-terminal cleavage/methylation domain-containing protein
MRSVRGFTLPEVLVAIMVFGIMSAALVSVLFLNVGSNRLAKEITEATSYAQSQIEALRNQPIAPTAASCPNAVSVPNPYSLSCSLGTAGNPVAGTRAVTVTVSWLDLGSRSVQLQSYVTY